MNAREWCERSLASHGYGAQLRWAVSGMHTKQVNKLRHGERGHVWRDAKGYRWRYLLHGWQWESVSIPGEWHFTCCAPHKVGTPPFTRDDG